MQKEVVRAQSTLREIFERAEHGEIGGRGMQKEKAKKKSHVYTWLGSLLACFSVLCSFFNKPRGVSVSPRVYKLPVLSVSGSHFYRSLFSSLA